MVCQLSVHVGPGWHAIDVAVTDWRTRDFLDTSWHFLTSADLELAIIWNDL